MLTAPNVATLLQQSVKVGGWLTALAALTAVIPVSAVPEASASASTAVLLSPVPETVIGLGNAWRRAENFAAAHEHCDVMVGRGDSMLPLYRDRTVLVVQQVPMAALHAGMTVVFVGDRGNPVAHVLQEQTPAGWRAMGVGNREADRTRVKRSNLLGVVIRAYTPAPRADGVAAQ